jgi:hypothetical protein
MQKPMLSILLVVLGVLAASGTNSRAAWSIESKDIYVSIEGPPTCSWEKYKTHYCVDCWFWRCNCADPNNPGVNDVYLGDGYTGPKSTTETRSGTSSGSTQAEAEASARAVPGFKAISGSVKVGYSWTTSYTYTETTYTGCENPSF